MKAVGLDEPFFVTRGKGAYLEDVDGNRYLDWVMSWGPLLFGTRIRRQARRGGAPPRAGRGSAPPPRRRAGSPPGVRMPCPPSARAASSPPGPPRPLGRLSP